MGFSRFQSAGVRAAGFIGTIAHNSFEHMILITVRASPQLLGENEGWKIGAAYRTLPSPLRDFLVACFYSAYLASANQTQKQKEEGSR